MDGSQRKRQYYVFWGFRASQAELLLGGSSYARLNVLNGTSVNSMVSSGKLLRVSYADGTVASHFDEAGMTAFVQFQWLRADDFSKRLTLLQDKGIVAIGDLKFDKLSIRLSKASASAQAAAVKRSSAQADFYFDPATFLLSKVVTPLKLPGTANTVLQGSLPTQIIERWTRCWCRSRSSNRSMGSRNGR